MDPKKWRDTMNTLPKKILYIIISLVLGLMITTHIIIAETFNLDFGYFSSGSGSGENASSAMSVVTGLSVSSEKAESKLYKQFITSDYAFVNTVNRAPVISVQSGFHLADLMEDPIDNKGDSITEILESNDPSIIDINLAAQRGIAIVDVNHMNGQWEYTTDAQNWTQISHVSEDNALLLAADIIETRIRFVPTPNHNGNENGNFTFRAWDQSRNLLNGSFANTQNNGDTYAFSKEYGFVQIQVININDPPIASAGNSYTANEGDIVQLDASQSEDMDDGIAQYIWKQTAGIAVELSDPSSVLPEFSVPEVDANGAFLSFRLEVSDHDGLTAVDTVSIHITNVLKEFHITSQAQTGGTISPDGDTIVMEGSNQVFTILPMSAYQVEDVVVDGISKGSKDRFTFWDVNNNHTIEVHFKEKPSIDAIANENGIIEPSGQIYVNEGDFQLFKITANEGYKIDDVIVNGNSIGPKSSYYFENVNGQNTISASFKPARFSISVQHSDNGAIQPANLVWVTEGNDQTFTITPVEGYEIESVTIDAQSAGTIDAFTFYDVTENHTISATFRKKPVISADVSGNGTIDPQGTVTVNYDSSQAFTMAPSEGYFIQDVSVDGNSIGPKSSYIFSNIQEDHQISVSFAQPTITATAGQNGQIEPSGKISVPSNSDQTFIITPIKDYEIDDVLIDDISTGAITNPTLWNIVDNHTIHAIFKPLPRYQITATANTGGKIESEQGESPLEIIRGGFAQFKITPDNGYEIEDVRVNGKSMGIITQYLFNDIQENQSIQVIFKEIITYTITATATEGGMISPSGAIVLEEGGYQLFNIDTHNNYQLIDVLVDQVSTGQVNSYAFTGDQNHTIHAIFEEIIIRSIHGRVIGEDIQNTANPGLSAYWIEVRKNGILLTNASSDESGVYTLTGLAPESNLIVSAWPPVDSKDYRRMYYNQQTSSETANPVSVTAADLIGIDFVLPKNYQAGIAGRVHDGNDPAKGIPNVVVDVFSQNATFGKNATTDEQGYYSIVGLKPESDYRVSVWSDTHNIEYFFALSNNQKQGDPPTFSVFSFDEATPITPMVPSVEHIDIIYNPNQGDRIGGQVFDSDGTPVAGIKVNAWSNGLNKGNMSTTDASGIYTITGLERVLFQDVDTNGYIVETQPENYPYQAYNGVADSASATKVATGRKDIDFHLRNGITVQGLVKNSEGQIVPNVSVSAWSVSDPELKRSQTQTDETGAYKIPNLPVADDYILAAFPKQYRIQYYDGKESDANATLLDLRYDDLSDLNFVLDKGYVITGHVFIELSPASDGIPVHIWSESTNTGGTVLTDLDGRFEIIGLSETASDYMISVRTEGFPPAFYRDNGDMDSMNDTVYTWNLVEGVSPAPWGDTPHRNINLVKGYTLSGRITYKDKTVPDIRIDAWAKDIGAWGQTVSTNDENINYTITGLAPGHYQLNIGSDIYAQSQMAITLTSQNKTLNIPILKPERTITGIVVGLETDTAIRLNAWSTSENTGKTIVLDGNDAVQSYKISGLRAASDYRVEIISDNYHYQVFKNMDNWDLATLIDLSDNNQEEIDFSLEKLPETATLFGKVVFPDDAQTGDKVWIQIQSKSLNMSKDIQVIFENAHGVNYSMTGFFSGNDYIAAARSDTFLNQYFDQVDERDDAQKIDMSSNPTDIDFVLYRGRSITGIIIDETLSPLVNASVEVWSDSNQYGGFATTDSDGKYRIAGLKQSDDFIVWVRDPVRGIFYYGEGASVKDSNKAKAVNTIPGDLTDIDIFVTQTYSIKGRITSSDGQILEGVWVDAQSVSSKKGGGTYTIEDGTFQVNGLTVGNDYKITVTPERPYIGQEKENVSAGDSQVDFILQAHTGVQLSGIIYASNGTPLAAAKIEVQSATDKDKYALVQTDSDGKYQIEDLPKTNDYIMNVWPLENSSDAFYSEQNLALTEDTVKNITLDPALKIAGVVTNKKGEVLKNIKVTVFSNTANFWKETQTDKNGAYEINNVSEAKDYVVTASADDYIKQEKDNLSPGTFNFILEQSGFISGYVRDKASGSGLAEVSVEIFSESMKGSEGYGGAATTDNTGFFKVIELKPVDQRGNSLNDYVVSVYADDYPDQSKGGKSVDDRIEFFLSKSTANVLSGTVENKPDGDTVLVDLFDTQTGFIKTLQADNAGHFTITGLSPEKSFNLLFISKILNIDDQWASSDGTGITRKEDAAIFKAGDSVTFSFSLQTKRKRQISNLQLGMSKDPMLVRNLRSTTHPYVKITRFRAATETSGQLTNKPNVTMQWDPKDTDSQQIAGYYSSFGTDAATKFNKFNTVKKPPIRTRKITSRDLEGDDVNYYFHVASVDKDGRIGQTSSIAFRIDTVPPTNVSVIPPIETNNRSVQLVLGATGASEMFISNVSYSDGGTWELRSRTKTWQLPEGSGTKKVYVRYRDKAHNKADASATTVYEEPVVVYTIEAIFDDNGKIEPEGKFDVEEGQSQLYTIIPDDGYRVDRVLIDGKAVNLNELTYTFENVDANHSIEVQFKRIEHRISITVGDNGKVDPNKNVILVPLNDNQAVTVIPNPGYGVDQVLVDGKSATLVDNAYTFDNMIEDHTFIVTFQKIITITASAGNFGKVEPAGQVAVAEGGFQSIQIIPDPGYEIDTVTVNDTPTKISGNVYPFLNVQSDQSIHATFQLTQFIITAIANANGTISPKGEVSVIGGADQQFTFTPDDGYEVDQLLIDNSPVDVTDFNYQFDSVTQDHTIAVSFARINTGPVAKETSVYTDEDIKVTGYMQATDIDGDSLTYQITVPGKLGRVHVVNDSTGEFVYTPNPNISGTDTITFTASDGKKTSDPGVVQVHIKSVNDPPMAYNQNLETGLAEPLSITLKAIDMDADPIQFNIVKTPKKGMLSGNAPYLTYNPFVHSQAIDTFFFTASDGKTSSITATVSITIGTPDAEFTCYEDTPITITIQDLQPGDTCIVAKQPEHGSITSVGRTVIYTPEFNFNGYDQFDYTADNLADTKTLKIYVRPVNDAPTIEMPLSLTMLEDDTLTISVTVWDPEQNIDEITVSYDQPPNGELSGDVPSLYYSPMKGFKGNDSITLYAMDGFDVSQKTMHITVEPKNVAPEVTETTHETLEDQTLSGQLLATDANGDELYFLLTENPSKGKATIIDPNTGAFTYTPNPNVNGQDKFSFKVNDGFLDSDIATITIDIIPVNDPPAAMDGSIAMKEDSIYQGNLQGSDPDNLQGSDPDNASLKFEIIQQGTLGHVTITNPSSGEFVFSPIDDQFGEDYFEFMVIDGKNSAYTAVAGMDVFITPVNDAPQVFGDEVLTKENTPVSITLTVTDIDSDISQLTYKIVEEPLHGDCTISGQQLTYMPDSDIWGEDIIKFSALDNDIYSNIAIIKIFVGVNKADIFTLEDQATAFTLPDNGNTGNIIYEITEQPTQGILTGVPPFLTYTPHKNFNGDDQLSYTINGGSPLELKIYVKPVNDAPVIENPDQTIELIEDTPLTLTLTAIDPDNDLLAFKIIVSPKYGELISTENENCFAYSPYVNYHGHDSFLFSVSDGMEMTSGRINFNILPVNDPPVAREQTVYALEETPIRINLKGSDIESDNLEYEILTHPQYGVVIDGNVYTPQLNYFGSDSLTFRAFDGEMYSDPAEVIIHVENINDPPSVINSSIEVDMSGMIYGRLQFSDPDNDVLISNIITQGTKGMAVLSNPVSGDFIYFADVNKTGMDVFAFTVNDSKITVGGEVHVTIKAPAIVYKELTIHMAGDYHIGDPYEYLLLISQTGKIYREGINNTASFNVPVAQGNYRLLIVAKNYQPFEYRADDLKIIEIANEPVDITSNLIHDTTFDPQQPTVEVSHTYNETGFELHVIRNNFNNFHMKIDLPDGTEKSVDKTIYTRSASRNGTNASPYTYQWPPILDPWPPEDPENQPFTKRIPNAPEDNDLTYQIVFKFYDNDNPDTPVDTYQVDYVIYGSSKSEEINRPPDEKE
ncbi:MAG: hypothetical protein OMM_06977, partial [Candidatus Magnetoglobus multicellularis str. Araruama]